MLPVIISLHYCNVFCNTNTAFGLGLINIILANAKMMKVKCFKHNEIGKEPTFRSKSS